MKEKLDRERIFWTASGIVFLILFYSYFYSDIMITTSHAVNLWDILFQGKIRDYYALCHADVDNVVYQIYLNPGYDFPIYVLFAVWNIPLYIAKKFMGVNIWQSALALMWAKSIILVFIILTVRALCRLCDSMGIPGEKRFATLYLLSSVFFGSCIVVNSQYDIIISYFMLNALDCYVRKNRKGFIAFIAAAATLKPFAFFLFAPLILYAEKNILRLLWDILCACIPFVGFKLLIPNNTQLVTYSTILTLFKNKITIADAQIPVFFLVSFIFWALCYIYKEPEEKDRYYRQVLLISYVSFAVFFVFCATNPYWCIMLIPFQGLLLALDKKDAVLGIILETAGSLCLVGYYMIEISWCYNSDLVRSSLIAKLFGMRQNNTNVIMDVVGSVSYTLFSMSDRISSMLFGLFAVTTLGFIWLNLFEHKNVALENRAVSDAVFYARVSASLAVSIMPLLLYIF